MIRDYFESLDELAFKGRNKAYGAYDMRRKYIRTLLISTIIGMFVVILFVLTPWVYFYFEPVQLNEGDVVYEVEYYDMSPPPDQDLNKLAQSLSQPIPDEPQVPVVKDTVIPEKEKPVENPPEEKKETPVVKADSAGKPGGAGAEGTGDETGLYTAIDVYPRFPGGDEARLYFLRQHIRYPEAALKNQIQGVVMVVFVVELDGSVSNVTVTQKVGGGCDE